MTEQCGTCNAWKETKPGAGLCRAYPPTAAPIGMQDGILGQKHTIFAAAFPTTQDTEWCRKWENSLKFGHWPAEDHDDRD